MLRDFEVVETADGSPSLKFLQTGEAMHNLNGAFSESLYIYHHGLVEVLKRKWTPHILSLGLGLAYNEMISLAEIYKAKTDFLLHSYEIEKQLNEQLEQWLSGEINELSPVYQRILELCATHFGIKPTALKTFMYDCLNENTWKLFGEFNTSHTQIYNCIYYDAFSEKTSPQLWGEDSMRENLKSLCTEECVLTTYAAKSSLKRILLDMKFEVIMRDGFAGKRQSTMAVRTPHSQ